MIHALDSAGSRPTLIRAPVEADEVDHSGRAPFCILLTIKQILNVATDADLRADMLAWSFNEESNNAQLLLRISSLHDTAIELRMTAANLLDGWSKQ